MSFCFFGYSGLNPWCDYVLRIAESYGSLKFKHIGLRYIAIVFKIIPNEAEADL